MSDSINRYAPPQAQVADVYSDPRNFQPVKLFSTEGRIGRVRYLAYSFVGFLALIPVFAVIAILASALHLPGLLAVAGVAVYVAFIVFTVFLTIQRCHDFNWSGWLVLLSFVPLGSLVFLLVPGTPDVNRFGAPPPPNSRSLNVLTVVMCVVIPVIGILAAIAIPAYQDYTKRARGAEQSSNGSSSWVQPQKVAYITSHVMRPPAS